MNLAERYGNRLLIDRIDILRMVFAHIKAKHPYANVILPEHLHCILTLPEGDSNFSTHWGLIKAHFYVTSQKAREFPKAAKNGGAGFVPEGASSSDGFGNTLFVMKWIVGNLSTTFIAILLSMVGRNALKIYPPVIA